MVTGLIELAERFNRQSIRCFWSSPQGAPSRGFHRSASLTNFGFAMRLFWPPRSEAASDTLRWPKLRLGSHA
jgi:hypothetical protein